MYPHNKIQKSNIMDALFSSKIGRELKDYVAITLGIICYALGWAAFMLPYQISTGGVKGI